MTKSVDSYKRCDGKTISDAAYHRLIAWWHGHSKTSTWHQVASVISYVCFMQPKLERIKNGPHVGRHRFTCFCGKRWYEMQAP